MPHHIRRAVGAEKRIDSSIGGAVDPRQAAARAIRTRHLLVQQRVGGSGADPGVAKIAVAFRLGRDVGPLGVLIAAPFRLVTGEEERLLLTVVDFRDDDRAADGDTHLIATNTGSGRLIEGPRRERRIARKPEGASVHLLTAALADRADDPASGYAVLSRERRGDYPDLGDVVG